MSLYFTADTHFGHKNIIEYCNRPFYSVQEMFAVTMANFNSVLTNQDHLYHLGDIAWSEEDAQKFLDNINCKQIHIVWGNHDHKKIRRVIQASSKVVETSEMLYINTGNAKVTLCHYPMLAWDGEFHLYGHWHAKGVKYNPRSMDVGVDTNGFKLWSGDSIWKKLNAQVTGIKP